MTIIRGVITYFRYYYSVTDDHLIVERGLLSTSKTSIPLDRIQAVDFDQTPIHKLVNLVKVNISTAGSSGSEATIEAVTIDKANELRDVLMHQQHLRGEHLSLDSQSLNSVSDQDTTRIFSLDPLQLLKVGLAENHIRSGFIIIGFFFWIIQQAEDADLLDLLKSLLPDINVIKGSVIILGVITILMIGASVLISLIKTIVQYYNLKLTRRVDSFQLSYGLLNSRQFTAKDRKIQVIGWERTWLQQLFDYYTLYFMQASSRSVSEKRRLSIPGCAAEHIQSVRAHLGYTSLSDETWQGVSPSYRFYGIRNLCLSALLIGGIILITREDNNYLLLVLLGLYFIYRVISIVKTYDKISYRIADGLVQITGGTFGSSLQLLESYKVQAIRLKAGLFHRRRDLADLYLYTASGSILIPFLPISTARQIRDSLLYTIESSSDDWM